MRGTERGLNSAWRDRLSYTLIVIIGILFLGVGVHAYTSSATTSTANIASTAGHSINELSPPSDCKYGQALIKGTTGSGWECSNIITSISTTYVRNVEVTSETYSTCGTGHTITCPSDKKIISGGCYIASGDSIRGSYPISTTGWYCISADSSSIASCTVYAICANY